MTIEIIDETQIKLYLNEGSADTVTLSGAQTLTNKTIDAADNTIVGTKAQFDAALTDGDFLFVGDAVGATGGTASGLTINDYTEKSFAVTGTTPALSPTNGPYQTWTLTANSTPTAGTWANGQSLTLHIDDGTSFVVSSWAAVGVTWKTNGGLAPTLQTTGVTVIQLWKISGVIYGARVGDA